MKYCTTLRVEWEGDEDQPAPTDEQWQHALSMGGVDAEDVAILAHGEQDAPALALKGFGSEIIRLDNGDIEFELQAYLDEQQKVAVDRVSPTVLKNLAITMLMHSIDAQVSGQVVKFLAKRLEKPMAEVVQMAREWDAD